MRVFGLAQEAQYGVRASEMTIHQRYEKASFGPQSEPVTLRLGSKDVQAARQGYAEPGGSTETTMDSKTIQYILMAILGNYTHSTTGSGSSQKHVHEFVGGENTLLPSFSADFVYDFARKQLVGLQADEVSIDVKDDLITVATEWIHKGEKGDLLKDSEGNLVADLEDQGLLSTANYTLKTKDGIPYIGYDCTLYLNEEIPTAVIKSCSLSIKVNHNREGARGIGHRLPIKKPSTGDREIEISLTSTMDKNSYKLMVAAEYGEEPVDLHGEWEPSPCKLKTLPLKLHFQTCEDATEYVEFIFENCIITCSPGEASGNDEIEVEFTLVPMGNKEVTMSNNSKVKTAIYAKVVNDQPEITAS